MDARHEALSTALKRLFDMDEEDAREVTTAVVGAFDGRDEVPDDRLEPDLRSIFYTLEAKKLLAFRREDYSTETGDRRRAFYWRFRPDGLRSVMGLPDAVREPDVYAALPASAWSRAARAS